MYKSALRLRGVFALRLISIVLLYSLCVCVFCFILFCVLVKHVSCIAFANKHLEPYWKFADRNWLVNVSNLAHSMIENFNLKKTNEKNKQRWLARVFECLGHI